MSSSILDTGKEKLLEMLSSPSEPPSPRSRLKALAIVVCLVGGIVYGVLRDDEGVMHVFRERSRLQGLGHSVSVLREENDRLRSDIRSLREDPRSVERLAREDLGLSYPGEIVFILESEPVEPGR